MEDLMAFQFFLPTYEDEKNYFNPLTPSPPPEIDMNATLPAGNYRVVDGQLFRILPGIPPEMMSF